MTILRPYQKAGVLQLLHFQGRALLADEMGLGKTLQALRYCQLKVRLRPILVICPASAKWVWQQQAQEHIHMASLILEGRQPSLLSPSSLPPLLIINYDIVKDWRPYLQKLRPQILILDEAQYIKNRRAQRTLQVHELGQSISHIMALSGTPLTNRPNELWSVLRLLRPQDYPFYDPFARRYCKRRWTRWGWDDRGAQNLPELHTQLRQTCMIRRCKEDVLKELPAKTRSLVLLPLERPAEYLRAEKDFLRWLAERSRASVRRIKHSTIEKLVQMGYLKQLAAELKLKAVYEWIDNFLESTDHKLVLFGWHHKILQALQKHYGQTQTVLIDGATPPAQRAGLVTHFQTSRAVRLFLGNIQAAGTAITLTAASHAAFIELHWVPGDHVQAEDRLHRIGQKSPVNIYYLVGQNTIEYDLCQAIQNKAQVLQQILDGSRPRREQMNLASLLEQALHHRHPGGL